MKNKLNRIEKKQGKDMKQILFEQWDKHGSQQGIAKELGVSQGTISLWMLRCGLSVKTILVDEKETA